MVSRAGLSRFCGQILLVVCGVCGVYALQGHFYACTLVLALIALWTAAAGWPNWPAPLRRERSIQESAAAFEQRLLTALLDQTPAPLLTLGGDGVIRAGNRAARSLFGTDDRLLAPPQALSQALAATPTDRTTLSLDTQSGQRAYALSITDLAGAQGGVRLAILIDIQPELRAAEAAALRELLQVLSHEIMNALTPVASLAATAIDLLADDTPTSTLLAREAVETLARRAAGLTRFVDAYRTLARLPPPHLQPTSLTAVADESARLFRSRWRDKGVELDLAVPAEDVLVSLDRDLVVHALLNVLSNAGEAALANPDRPPRVGLAAAVSDDGAAFSITDSGAGVAQGLGGQVFQPFFTTKPEGTGVGLSFARQVAMSHGGDLVLEAAQAGSGARFTLHVGR
jgi:signal transduction histidine kinase